LLLLSNITNELFSLKVALNTIIHPQFFRFTWNCSGRRSLFIMYEPLMIAYSPLGVFSLLVVSMLPFSMIFVFDFGTVPTVWYCGTVPTVWYCGTVPTVRYVLQCGIVELFRQCGILELFRQWDMFYFSYKKNKMETFWYVLNMIIVLDIFLID
jgi:hypothetical protein